MQNCSFILANHIPIELFNVLAIVLLALFIFSVFVMYREILFRIVGILVIIGGIINLVGRVSTGCVYDPFNFFGLFYFNFADLLITLGVGLLIYRTLTKDEVS